MHVKVRRYWKENTQPIISREKGADGRSVIGRKRDKITTSIDRDER